MQASILYSAVGPKEEKLLDKYSIVTMSLFYVWLLKHLYNL